MSISRRKFMKELGAGLGLSLAYGIFKSQKTSAEASPSSKAVMYDITKCVGCRTCEMACQDHNHLPLHETESEEAYWDNPRDMEANVYTIVKIKRLNPGYNERRFVKWQCMHCVEPTCANVCPTSALYKTEEGPVLYDETRCIGCQYCIGACPFSVPRFDWHDERVVTKCTMCADRQAEGLQPACVANCPSGALQFGDRESILAKVQAAEDKGLYVYGKDEAGGTAWIYVSDIPFYELGFPTVASESFPEHSQDVFGAQMATILGGAAVIGLYSLYLRRKKIEEEQK